MYKGIQTENYVIAGIVDRPLNQGVFFCVCVIFYFFIFFFFGGGLTRSEGFLSFPFFLILA